VRVLRIDLQRCVAVGGRLGEAIQFEMDEASAVERVGGLTVESHCFVAIRWRRVELSRQRARQHGSFHERAFAGSSWIKRL
jgi:hypothetical protein